MAVTATVYGMALKGLGQAKFDFVNDDLYVMLTTSEYTPNRHTHQYKSSVTNEVVGDGYVAGGEKLENVTWTYNSVAGRVELSCDATVWDVHEFTARYAVVYKNLNNTDSTSPLLSYLDFEEDQEPSEDILGINWTAGGLFRINALVVP